MTFLVFHQWNSLSISYMKLNNTKKKNTQIERLEGKNAADLSAPDDHYTAVDSAGACSTGRPHSCNATISCVVSTCRISRA